MTRIWALAILSAATLATAAPALKDRPSKEAPIFGEWIRVGHTEAGKPLPPDHAVHHQWFMADGEWKYSYGDRPDNTRGKNFVIDTGQSPRTIDISMQAGGKANWRGIYKVEGDTLTLCLVTGDRERPKTFESSPDRPTTIWIFNRVKPKE